ncbi:methylated-DNA--[protein]-cysteine S-methyltransferase [Caulobacter sp. KR2-114]|uniref:methylated-DNA--[protein]-cysteine S-methyltransferase n=1 Tax=Caulobacter sp. KR2-114 TaxID=3400912 RepID=UPI003C05004C
MSKPAPSAKPPLELAVERIAFAAGVAVLMTDPAGRVRVLDFEDYEPRMQRLLRRHYGEHGWTVREAAAPTAARRALEAYFAGDLTAIDGLETATAGTAFQRDIWKALRTIPAGQTASYRDLAQQVGRPAAVRATGAANGANPIGIIVPCHRVIGAGGDLTGYGGGLPRKRWLLEHEGALTG